MRGGLCLLICSLFSRVACRDVLVKVKQGSLIGSEANTVFQGKRFYAFYKIPYAKPPIRRLRFRDPVAEKKWGSGLDARLEYHGACAQPHIVHKYATYGSEDCLYLNIYTPYLPEIDTDKEFPVIVWIHGYAFTSSLSHIHGPDFLIDNDVIVVTVTHRIGPFGFFKLNKTDTHANMGLKDIVMALKWIRRNIKSFAGDKKKVTVMGSGSGATFLSWLLMTKARNLFSKMILQSGGLFTASFFLGQEKDHLDHERLAQELLKQGVQKPLSASAEKITSAGQKIYSTIDVINYQRPLIPFGPSKEEKTNKSLITMFPDEFIRRATKFKINLPMLIGYNSQESISELIPFIHNPAYMKMFSSIFKFMVPYSDGCHYNYTSETYASIANKIKYEYFRDGISEKSIHEFLRYTSDLHKYPLFKFIQTILKINSNKMFVYKFNFVGAFNAVKNTSMTGAHIPIKGAASGDEVCYLLKCEPMWTTYLNLKNGSKNINKIMIKQMAQWWANFAKSGDPTPEPSEPHWSPITLNDDSLMLIGKESKLIHPRSDKKAYTFWDEIYNNHYKNELCQDRTHDEL